MFYQYSKIYKIDVMMNLLKFRVSYKGLFIFAFVSSAKLAQTLSTQSEHTQSNDDRALIKLIAEFCYVYH